VLSSVTVVELEHGLHRVQSAQQAQNRRSYLDTVFAAIPVEGFSKEMAQIAAKVDAISRKAGKVNSVPGFAHWLDRSPLRLCRRNAESAPFQMIPKIPNLPVLSI
jgi:predicted nucleic acid-binding protein